MTIDMDYTGFFTQDALNFSSILFIFRLLPIFLAVYYIVPARFRNGVLLVGSVLFYTMADPKGLPLLFLSVLLNFLFARRIAAGETDGREPGAGVARRRKIWLALALLYDFGMLFLFKYVGQGGAMPLGMSFYTFRIVSYVLDVYNGRLSGPAKLSKLAGFVCMFPTLVSGPVTRYGEIAPQWEGRRFSWELFEDGCKQFVLGFASKILLADRIGILWHEIQTAGFESISTPLAWMGAFAYTFQIYFDFQGYSLMALGIGRMLGFSLPDNFRQPYAAKSVGEFWRRWHITLGQWFRDYVYIPLGGNRKGRGRTILNLLVVWILTGMWHGSTWNFILWGVYIWIFLTAERTFLGRRLEGHPILSHLYMAVVIPISWVIFAIQEPGRLWLYLGRLFPLTGHFGGVNATDYLKYGRMFGGLFLLCVLFCLPCLERFYEKKKRRPLTLILLLAIFWIAVYYASVSSANPFLYLDF